MWFPLNELQRKLDYKFENIQLLHEALTHDFDTKRTEWDIFGDGNVFYKKRKLNRLKCVGVSVLKLLIAEKAVKILSKNKDYRYSDEGFLTGICNGFHKQCNFQVVAYYLKICNFIYSRDKIDITTTSVIKEVIQAIFGAVFIDGGGCESEKNCAMQSVRKLLDKLISSYGLCCYTLPELNDLQNCVVTNPHDISRDYLLALEYAVEIKPCKTLENKMGYKFQQPNILQAALTHDSVRGYISNVSHYEVLEFLGDAVYELVICDYLFWHYINDTDGKIFNFRTVTKFVGKKFQQVLANGLKLQKFLIKPDRVTVNDIHDFLESVVGAIYVDAESFIPVKIMLVRLCRQFERETIESCNICLPYGLRTYYGSWHYQQNAKLSKTKEEHERPPIRQDQFKIIDLNHLKVGFALYYGFEKIHGGIRKYDNHAKLIGTESWCNQQEFGRVGLFQTMIRIWYLGDKVHIDNNLVNLYYSHDHFDKETPTKIQGRALPSESCVNCKKLKSEVSKPNSNDVLDASNVIRLWIYNLVTLFLSSLGKLGLKTIQLLIFVIKILGTTFGFIIFAFIILALIWSLVTLIWPIPILLILFLCLYNS